MNSETSERPRGQAAAGAIVRGSSVRLSNDSARVGVPGSEPVREPRIELIRVGGIVQAIDVFCSCGQHIRLRCLDS